LSHHGRAHVVASHTGRAALLHTALLAGVEATLLAAEALFLEAAVVAVILVTAQITSGLSLLDFNVFAQDLQGTFESSVDGSLTVKVASRTRPNCMKKFLKSASVASCETPPTKILLVRSCSSRGIALLGSICGMVSCGHDGHGRKTHDLAVKLVFLHHDDVDGLRVSESEETESARTSSCTITHDSALRDFAELIAQELGLLTICCLPVQTTDEHFAVKNSQRHDCAEEQAIFFEFPECLVQNPGSRTRSFALIVKTAVGNASDRTAEQDQVQVEFLNPCLQGHNKAVQAYMLVASRLAVILVICWHSRLPTLQAPANSSAHHVLYMRYFLRWGLVVIIASSAMIHLLSSTIVVTLVLVVVVVVPVLLGLLLLFVPTIVGVLTGGLVLTKRGRERLRELLERKERRRHLPMFAIGEGSSGRRERRELLVQKEKARRRSKEGQLWVKDRMKKTWAKPTRAAVTPSFTTFRR
ncbi:hypothetical protein KCV00_g251, partial [Aureobasidium melanogenum]